MPVTDSEQLLDGLDTHPWAETSHAYGSAEDLPGLLRDLIGSDREMADNAVWSLNGNIFHQGTVYAASAEAVPFLARIAAAGYRSADVLMLLGGMAKSEDEGGGITPGAVRVAVAKQLSRLLPLLDNPEPDVRQAAAWTVGHTRMTDGLAALRGRWDVESETLVRAELITAITRLDYAVGAYLAGIVMAAPHPPELRMAAVLAALDAGQTWTNDHQMTLLSLLPANRLMEQCLDLDRHKPLAAVTEILVTRNREKSDRDYVFALLNATLRSEQTEVRAEALWPAELACIHSRSAPRQLMPALLSAIAAAADNDQLKAVAPLLSRIGVAATSAAPLLLPVASRNPDRADDQADDVLAALVNIAPTRAAPLLARGLGNRPDALYAAVVSHQFPYDDELLAAIRPRLYLVPQLASYEVDRLASLLAGWGTQAAAAVPELCAALPHFPQEISPALSAVAAACPLHEQKRMAGILQEAIMAGDHSLAVAKALYDLTGDSQALRERLSRQLMGSRYERSEAVAMTSELGPEGVSLELALREALSDPDSKATTSDLNGDTELAEALWRTTQHAPTAVGVLYSVFTRAAGEWWFRWSELRAARVAALLGPAGRPLTPQLELLLHDPITAAAATVALTAVAEAGSLDRAMLASVALGSAETGADPMGACDALDALGASALTPESLRRLEVLGNGDARVSPNDDERFQKRVIALLESFSHLDR